MGLHKGRNHSTGARYAQSKHPPKTYFLVAQEPYHNKGTICVFVFVFFCLFVGGGGGSVLTFIRAPTWNMVLLGYQDGMALKRFGSFLTFGLPVNIGEDERIGLQHPAWGGLGGKWGGGGGGCVLG